jgi:hypothetical protein
MKSNGELIAEIARLNDIIEEQAGEITVFTIELRSLRVELERQNEKESGRDMQEVAGNGSWSWQDQHTNTGTTTGSD